METCSRCRGIHVHDPVETLFTIAWNTHVSDGFINDPHGLVSLTGDRQTFRQVTREYPSVGRVSTHVRSSRIPGSTSPRLRAYPSVLAAHAEPGNRRRRLMIIQRLPVNSFHETHVIRSSIDVQIQIFHAIGCRGRRQNPAIPLQSRQVRHCPAGVNIWDSITRNSLERNAHALSGAWLGQIQHTLRHDVNRDQISRMIFFGTDAGNFGELLMVFRNDPGARERRVQASVFT